MFRCLRTFTAALLAACSIGAAGLVGAANAADAYPSRPITIIAPFAAGGVVDAQARLIAEQLQAGLNQPVIVENRAGAQGTIGSKAVAMSEPDGYTLVFASNGTHATNVSLFKSLPYDPQKNFAPIGLVGGSPWVLTVAANSPHKDLDAFLAALKAQPNRYNGGYLSASSQVALSLFKKMGKIDATEVPYKGTAQAVTDLIGGSIDFMFLDLGSALAQQAGGKVRLLGVSTLQPSTLAPNIPTLHSRLSGYEIVSWAALMAPAGTPDATIDTLNQALRAALDNPALQQRFATMGLELYPESKRTPAALGQLMARDIVHWRELIDVAGIQAN